MMMFRDKANPEQEMQFYEFLKIEDYEEAWNLLQRVTNTKLEPMDSTSTMGQDPIEEQPIEEQPIEEQPIIEQPVADSQLTE